MGRLPLRSGRPLAQEVMHPYGPERRTDDGCFQIEADIAFALRFVNDPKPK